MDKQTYENRLLRYQRTINASKLRQQDTLNQLRDTEAMLLKLQATQRLKRYSEKSIDKTQR